MDPRQIPFVRHVAAIGPDNRVFDGLLVSGPLIVLLVVVFGRNAYTLGLALGYLVLFVAGVAVAAVRRSGLDGSPMNARN